MTLQINAKSEEKLTLDSETFMWNLVNFNASIGKSENFHFDGLLLPIAYKFQLKGYRGMISHDTEE